MYENCYPDTAEKRRAGMADLRGTMLAAKLRALAAGGLTPRVRYALEDDVAHIQAVQAKFGEVA